MLNKQNVEELGLATSGAYLVPQHQSSTLKVYPVSEDKLEALGILDLMSNIFLSLSFASLGLLGACVWDIKFTEGVSLGGEGFATFIGVIFAAFGFCTYLLMKKRKSTVDVIKENCTETQIVFSARPSDSKEASE